MIQIEREQMYKNGVVVSISLLIQLLNIQFNGCPFLYLNLAVNEVDTINFAKGVIA